MEEVVGVVDVLIGVTEARDQLKKLLEDDLPKSNVVILRHNRAVGVLMSPLRYDLLLARLEDLEDENAILRHRLEPDVITHEEAVGKAQV